MNANQKLFGYVIEANSKTVYYLSEQEALAAMESLGFSNAARRCGAFAGISKIRPITVRQARIKGVSVAICEGVEESIA